MPKFTVTFTSNTKYSLASAERIEVGLDIIDWARKTFKDEFGWLEAQDFAAVIPAMSATSIECDLSEAQARASLLFRKCNHVEVKVSFRLDDFIVPSLLWDVGGVIHIEHALDTDAIVTAWLKAQAPLEWRKMEGETFKEHLDNYFASCKSKP